MKLPDDADGDAMRRVLDDGSDPTIPMDVDFMVACPTVEIAEAVAPLASARGYSVKISQDNAGGSFTCYCMKSMLLDYDTLIAVQHELDEMGQALGARIDGWGTFGNVP